MESLLSEMMGMQQRGIHSRNVIAAERMGFKGESRAMACERAADGGFVIAGTCGKPCDG